MFERIGLGLVLALIGACSQQPAGDPPQTPVAEAPRLESIDEFVDRDPSFGDRAAMPGAALYAEHCAACHTGGVAKAPHLTFLEMLPPSAILAAMNEGVMQPQSAALDAAERRHVAEYITQTPADARSTPAFGPECAAGIDLDPAAGVVAAGWGHDTRRYTRAQDAGLAAADAPALELKWAYAYPDALRARSQPSVGFGAVFVGSHDGTVYAFDLETGCTHWRFAASGEVRTGIVLVPGTDSSPPLAVFGDILARLYAVNALTGDPVWSFKVDNHASATLTATPTLAGRRVLVNVSSLEVTAAANEAYACCTFRGRTVAVDVDSGEVQWTHFAIPEPPVQVATTRVGTPVMAPSGAPLWASPTVDERRGRVYVGTGENYSSPADGNSDAIIAIDLATGERLWTRQTFAGDAWNVACMLEGNPNCPEENGPDLDHGSSILLVDVGEDRQVLVAGLKTGEVLGLDPDDEGALLWRTRLGRGSIQGGVHFGLAAEGTTVYVPINDMNDRSGRPVPDLPARPGIGAVDAATGKLLWQHVQEDVCPESLEYCDPGISAAVSAFPGAVVAGHLDGFLRVYARDSGEVLWAYDTKVPVEGVNGITARGGSMSGAGPMIANGYLIANSGYGLYFHSAGNMLAVFAPADR